LDIIQKIRKEGIAAETDLMGRNFSNQLKFANKQGIERIVIVGQKDIKGGKVTIKDMKSGEQKDVNIEKLIGELK
jgi:histidyl-tRNA synthetase